MEKIKLEKVPSSRFEYEKHEMDNSRLPYESAFGYRKSEDVECLSKINNVCVFMFDEDRGEFWVHMPYDLFNHYYEVDEDLVEKEQSIEEYGKEFERILLQHAVENEIALIRGNYTDSLSSNKLYVSAENNNDGLMHFIKKPNQEGWWAFNLEDSVCNKTNVKVVNEVGGYHYLDFTKCTIENGYEFAKAKSRRYLD